MGDQAGLHASWHPFGLACSLEEPYQGSPPPGIRQRFSKEVQEGITYLQRVDTQLGVCTCLRCTVLDDLVLLVFHVVLGVVCDSFF